MTDTVYGQAASELPLFRIRETRDRRALDAALSEDRAYSAYALGHLELGLFERAHFWLADGPTGTAVVLHATALGRTMFVAGDAVGIGAILSLHPGPRTSYLTTCSPEHLPALEQSHVLSEALHMTRMSVTQPAFSPVQASVQRLRGFDVREVNALYALDGAPAYYTARHIESGVYYGIFQGARLVSVAGTHVVAPHASVAVVGNVLTHPAHRGRGLATAVTSSVTAELFGRGCGLVTLTVDPKNSPAVQAYRRLGYTTGAPVVEARARRRDPVSIGAWLRRRVARRRGRLRATLDSGAGEYADIDEYAPGRPLPVDDDRWR